MTLRYNTKNMLKCKICILAAVAFMFTGCGKIGNYTDEDNLSEKNNTVTKLTLWSISTESDSFHEVYKKAIEDFEKEHEGVKIIHETFENESYKTKIKSSVAANELPDVFYTWAGGFSPPFVEAGKVLPLDEYYEKYRQEISETVLANITYDGKLYGSVMCTPVSVMWYNQKIFNENNIAVPETWDEFENACKTLKNKDIAPIAISAKDKWVLAMLHDGLTLKSAGAEKLQSVLKKQGGSYMEPEFLVSAQKIHDLVEMGAFISGAADLSNDEASAEFYRGNAAMYFTGSWMGASIIIDADNPEDFSVAPIPVINPSNAKITDYMGGGSDSLMVSASTSEPELAATLAFEISKNVSKYGYLSGAGIPAWKVTYDDSSVPELNKKVAEYANSATSFTLWFDTLMEAEDAGVYLTNLQRLYTGTETPEEFQIEMTKQLDK